MIDRIRQVGHLCRPFDVAKKILILQNAYKIIIRMSVMRVFYESIHSS